MEQKKVNPFYAFAFRSSSSLTVYESLLYSDGSMTCNCPGWTIKKKDKERDCTHLKTIRDGRVNLALMELFKESKLPPEMSIKTKSGNFLSARPYEVQTNLVVPKETVAGVLAKSMTDMGASASVAKVAMQGMLEEFTSMYNQNKPTKKQPEPDPGLTRMLLEDGE